MESQLQSLQTVIANQQRRLDTNRLELHFEDASSDSRSGRIGDVLCCLLDETTEGVTDALGLLVFGLPFLLGLPAGAAVASAVAPIYPPRTNAGELTRRCPTVAPGSTSVYFFAAGCFCEGIIRPD